MSKTKQRTDTFRKGSQQRPTNTVPVAPVVRVAFQIDGLQKQRAKNLRRLDVISKEHSTLTTQNQLIEQRRLALLLEQHKASE